MVNLFISWSGTRSQLVAEALREHLPFVINELDIFVSMDIEAGARWQEAVATKLEVTNFGFVIVSKENQDSRWLNFEAGALAKTIDASRVVPFPVNLSFSEIRQPLGQFQAKELTHDGVLAAVEMINDRCEKQLTKEHLGTAFDRFWPDIERVVQQARDLELPAGAVGSADVTPSQHDMLSEILTTVRQLARSETTEPIERTGLAEERLTLSRMNAMLRAAHDLNVNYGIKVVDVQPHASNGRVAFIVAEMPSDAVISKARSFLQHLNFQVVFRKSDAVADSSKRPS
jgi:hypothetical protein